jgi:quercetin dioxygenase-like cupin family protein
MSTPQPVLEYQHRDWATIPATKIADGIERQMIWGERLMVCRLRFDPRVRTEVHSHPNEQITIVERGRLLFTIGAIQRAASAGDILHFPAGVAHGATILEEETVLIDIFSPVRSDFLPTSEDGVG